jgi:fructokinase
MEKRAQERGTGPAMRLGIDLGGTKIEAAVLDLEGRIVHRKRVETPRSGYEDTLEAIVALVEEAERAAGAALTVGMGTPGALSLATGLMKNANSTWLLGRPFKADIEARLGREVRMANDANCFALSEAVDGAGAGAEVVFGVILGTGVGGGIVVHGRVLTGANAIAGEWGHNALPAPRADELAAAPRCYCGRTGCIEAWLSGPALRADHERGTGERLEAREIARRSAAGDEGCEATFARYEERLARALGSIVNVLDPDVVVLGGGVSNVERLYERLPRLLPDYVFSDEVRTRVARAVHGDSGGVRGAAWLWAP